VKAVVYRDYGAPPELAEVPPPRCPDGGVVIAVRATGVCRSDWHAWQGHDPVALPHIPGHELAGVVAQAAPGVTRWRPGDRVTVPFACGCGRCGYCRSGQAQVCPDQTQPGFTRPGSFAEFVAIEAADENLVALPGRVGFTAAASLGCRFATAFRALTAHGRLGRGEWLAVHGCGGVGLAAVHIGAALGARVVAVDVSGAALAAARGLGAEAAVRVAAAGEPAGNAGDAEGPGGTARDGEGPGGTARDGEGPGGTARDGEGPGGTARDGEPAGDPAATVRDLTGGGAHVSVDALGSPGTAAAALRGLRRRGRHVQVGLLLGADAAAGLPMDLVIARELEIYGSHGMAARDYPPMLDLVAGGTLRPERLVGEVIGLAGAGDALAAMSRPAATAGMTVIEIPPPG
jgi:D-arabinose 1-dehydrogenase-like Zn-dependent alcohol dehydrogenase